MNEREMLSAILKNQELMTAQFKTMQDQMLIIQKNINEGFNEVNERLDRNDQRFSWLESDLNRTKSKIR